ncbi:MAG TPA: GxxExxY protein [Gemmatimonadaceae bacterium]|jgi:iron complex transport system substrate-binding protein|nr:GxxExxY protein [Gemmatimonadaceae bacterium]
MSLERITGAIVDASVRIHRDIGPGLFESVYETALAASLERRGLQVERQVPIAFSYDGVEFDQGFRIDLLVERCVIVEIKSVERFASVHVKQILTYLRLADIQIGLILNFGADMMKEGIKRVINDLPRSSSPPLLTPHSPPARS